MLISKEKAQDVYGELAKQEARQLTPEEENAKREALRTQAMEFLLKNQETFVAQWILQNPYAQMSKFRLKFVYNDKSMMGYTVEMEEIEDV